jgi:hypothetical protein
MLQAMISVPLSVLNPNETRAHMLSTLQFKKNYYIRTAGHYNKSYLILYIYNRLKPILSYRNLLLCLQEGVKVPASRSRKICKIPDQIMKFNISLFLQGYRVTHDCPLLFMK